MKQINPCECGCGSYPSGKRYRFSHGHWAKTPEGKRRLFEANHKGQPCEHGDGYKTIKPSYGRERILEHRFFAEKVLGRPIPKTAVIHHLDGKKGTTHPKDIIICQDDSYHHIIERRTRALRESGHAHWRKCYICKRWDDPANLVSPGGVIQHRECGNAYRREWAKRKREGS